MTHSSPRLSIGLPVFNSERYLPQALDSLLNQTFRDFELIISDNASTDRTQTICRSYAARDDRLRYFREAENRGASWNFNRVVELATAPYFKWAAHDDYCAPSFVERCLAVLERDSSVVCCHSKTQKVDAYGNALPLPDPTEGGLVPGRHRHRFNAQSSRAHLRFRDVLLSSGWSVRCYGLMRTEALRQTGLLRPVYGYEKILMAKLSLFGRFYDVPETLFFQRLHLDASSHLGTAAEQRLFFAAAAAQDHHSFPRIEYLRGYTSALWRAPITTADRLMGMVWIGRYLFQVSKWAGVALSAVRGTGTGGSHRALVDRLSRRTEHP